MRKEIIRERKAEKARSRKEPEDTNQQRQDEMNRWQQTHKTLKMDYGEQLKKYDDLNTPQVQ